ncbi:RagB/SusD family nutrient uptake outer membrane protein [Pedobacter sp. MC2016-05]|uniref:RagB/SusD family nutrient uptake outer membrane protein n=1 Tax=Pedobacter sp. MC2016-05 TaxID=2994474 RepID=UPI002245923B|nr:RagB/SusD family nutrient uptake outer membrane protein [Pedobacter sp. MC2016-05]MCX2475386.1 RagB/SusD family nutrient uptake outer membrane protein [Pedobacter sp. MC2016-05]
MKSKYKLSILSFAVVALMGCKKYVDIKTQGNLVPNQTINYRYLLNNTSGFEQVASIADFASSDIVINDASQQSALSGTQFYNYLTSSYNWQSVIYPLGSPYEQDANWNTLYATILTCNTIINELPSSDGTQAQKDAIAAEALVHRADAYLNLVNTYAKPYSASTAATDLGVPLLLTQTVSQSLNRASIQAIYNQIISDLLTAIPSLPATQAYNTLPSKPSAYGELARCYLMMKDFGNAGRYAEEALKLRNTLIDYANITAITTTNYPRRIINPEILLSKIPTGGSLTFAPTVLKLSDDFLTILGTSDQRYRLFTVPATTVSATYTGRFQYKESLTGETRNQGVSVPEMMLIRAEAFARSGDIPGAMNLVNALRIKRFRTADFVPLSASSATEALNEVINERRREFFGNMLRWWDMRRLNSETAFQRTYTRTFNGVTYTLSPGSNRYTFPIAEYLRNLNPELEANP